MTITDIQTKIAARTNGGENPIATERELWTILMNESCKLYEVKEIDVNLTTTPTYLTDNFDGTGLGIGEMLGFAICNGANGTRDRKGRASIGYDPTNYPTPGVTGGAKQVSLVAANIPKLDITVPVSDAGGGTATPTRILAGDAGPNGSASYVGVTGNTTPTAVAIMQPYIVTLFIQRIA